MNDEKFTVGDEAHTTTKKGKNLGTRREEWFVELHTGQVVSRSKTHLFLLMSSGVLEYHSKDDVAKSMEDARAYQEKVALDLQGQGKKVQCFINGARLRTGVRTKNDERKTKTETEK